jgi:hypothetical protein
VRTGAVQTGRRSRQSRVRELALRQLEPLNRTLSEPLRVTNLGDFVDRVYLPFVKQQKRPSTYRGYSLMWADYLEIRCILCPDVTLRNLNHLQSRFAHKKSLYVTSFGN